jgi:hypothetical protein
MRSKLQVVDISTSELLNLAGDPALDKKTSPKHDGSGRAANLALTDHRDNAAHA